MNTFKVGDKVRANCIDLYVYTTHRSICEVVKLRHDEVLVRIIVPDPDKPESAGRVYWVELGNIMLIEGCVVQTTSDEYEGEGELDEDDKDIIRKYISSHC